MLQILQALITLVFIAGITLVAVGASLSTVPMIIGGIVLIAGSSVGYMLGRM
jgi:hypothetical protein